MGILTIVGGYLAIGLAVLILFDLLTRRIRNKLRGSSTEARGDLAASGTFVGAKESMLLVVGALWLFWPLVIVSALIGGKKRNG